MPDFHPLTGDEITKSLDEAFADQWKKPTLPEWNGVCFGAFAPHPGRLQAPNPCLKCGASLDDHFTTPKEEHDEADNADDRSDAAG